MNDFDLLLKVVADEISAVGIQLPDNISRCVLVNKRATKRFGLCKFDNGIWRIELTDRLLNADEFACKQTLAHELLHTCKGCANHGNLWKKYADIMNKAYGYSISRTDSPEKLGISDTSQARYIFMCDRCGAVVKRERVSRFVKHPERYRCKCGGKFIKNS